MSDYIYRNSDDTKRVKIFKRETSLGVEWDADIWDKDSGDVITFSSEYGDLFQYKREAKAEIEKIIGKVVSINPETVTQGW